MKKALTLFVAVLLLISIVAVGETIDLSALTLEEMAELHNRIDMEIGSRFGKEWGQLGEGLYQAGKNIKAGAYEIIATKIKPLHIGISLVIYANEKDAAALSPALWYSHYNPVGTNFTVFLEEGYVLRVEGGGGIIRTASSFFTP